MDFFHPDGSPVDVRPISGALGAEVFGFDLSRTQSETELALIRSMWAHHLVLAFRGQDLDVFGLESFSKQMGDLGDTPFVTPVDGHPHVLRVLKEAHEVANFGGSWHSDWSFQPLPPSATILYAVDVPPVGGDTAFTNMYLAYERLPSEMRSRCDGLEAIHSARGPYGSKGHYSNVDENRSMEITASTDADGSHVHPLVRVHPETGRKVLFCNPVYTVGIDGMGDEEGAAFLAMLNDHASRLDFTCRVRWEVGTLTMWDNRCTQHYAINDYSEVRREMLRTTIVGEVPVPVLR